MVVCACHHPSYSGIINRRIRGPGQPRHKCEALILRTDTTRRAGAMVQVLEHLPDKHKALNSNPSTTHTHTKGNFVPIYWKAQRTFSFFFFCFWWYWGWTFLKKM
jgi:hypothetical protein